MSKQYFIYRSYLLIGLMMSIFLISCSKDDEPKPVVKNNSANEPIAKKWEVDNTASNGRLAAEASDFLWFEFTLEGYFIILKSDLTTLTGTYTFVDNTITLDGVGVLEISDVSDTNFSFTFTPTGATESVTIFTNVAEEVIETTSQTDLLCKTWSVSRQYGVLFGTEYDQSYPNAAITDYTVVFSQYGTYLLAMTAGDGRKTIMNRHWQWKNSEETMICFGDFSSECTGENETTVVSLTEAGLELHTLVPSMYSETHDVLEIYKN